MFDPEKCDHVSMADAKNRTTQNPVAELSLTASVVFVTLAQAELLDDTTILEHANLFAVWSADMAPSSLKRGLIVLDGGELYRLSADLAMQNCKPQTSPDVWAKIGGTFEEWPPWAPWIGGLDLYQSGDKVSHSGRHWVSLIDENIGEPGFDDHSWKEVV